MAHARAANLENTAPTASAGPPGSEPRWRQVGQALVEFALVVPIFLVLIFAVVDFGFGLNAHIAVTNASREGARYGSVGYPVGSYPPDCNENPADDRTVVGRVCSALGRDVSNVQQVTVVTQERNGVNGIQNGDSIVVTITYRYDFITPLGPLLATFTPGALPTYLDLQSSSDMRLE